MKKKNDTPLGLIRCTLDEILVQIRQVTRELSGIEQHLTRQIEALRALAMPRAEALKADLAAAEKQLRKIAKKNDAVLFSACDRAEMKSGAVVRSVQDVVRLPRDILKRLEAAGRDDMIKIAKSVDRDQVRQLPVEALEALGGSRENKTVYGYEVEGAENRGQRPEEA
jgi:hypothetical protein